jgi:hypothetical protein
MKQAVLSRRDVDQVAVVEASHLRFHELHNICMLCKPALTERVWLTYIATATACALSDYLPLRQPMAQAE